MKHMFDVNIAVNVGIEGAVILEMFRFLLSKLKANEESFRDGRTWLKNSRRALSKLFPYMKEDRIRRVTDTLVDNGYLIKGSFDGADRSLYYALPDEDSIWQSCQIHLANLPNPSGKSAKCTIYKEDSNKNNNIYSMFEVFWKMYPRRTGVKKTARDKWGVIVKNGEATQEQIIEGLKIDMKTWQDEGRESHFLPHPTTWLNQRRFNDALQREKDVKESTPMSAEQIIEERMKKFLSENK